MSRIRQRALLGLGAALLAPALVACGAGANAITNLEYAPADGLTNFGSDGQIRVLNALVVAPRVVGGPAVVTMGVADLTGEGDELLAITLEGVGEVLLEGETEVPPGGLLQVGGQDAELVAVAPDFQLLPGQVVPMAIAFENAGVIDVRTIIYAPVGPYETVRPPVLPDATEPAVPTESPTDVDEIPTDDATNIDEDPQITEDDEEIPGEIPDTDPDAVNPTSEAPAAGRDNPTPSDAPEPTEVP